MADSSHPDTQEWLTAHSPQTQTSWLFYAVTRIRGSYVPVAVTAYSPTPADKYPEVLSVEHSSRKVTGVIYGHQIASSVLACVRIFSELANKQFILAEMDLASEHYRDLPSALMPEMHLPEHRDNLRDTVQAAGAKFPFIQTCLEHGAANDIADAAVRADFWMTLPLRVAYRRHASFGAVVVDITDLKDVGYGIVASTVHNQTTKEYAASEDGVRDYKNLRQMLAEDQGRSVLGVGEYLRLADNDGGCCSHVAKSRIQADVESLSQARKVGMEALHVIWPDGERTEDTLRSAPGSVRSLFDLAWRGASQAESLFGDSLSWVSRLAPFRAQLPAHLRDMHTPRMNDGAGTNGPLLQMLCSKFDLAGDVCIVRPQNLTTELLEETLGMAAMPDCDDTVSLPLSALQGQDMSESDYVTQRLEQVKKVYVLQYGDQDKEHESLQVRRNLQEIVPNAHIVFSDMYSASLRRLQDADEPDLQRSFARAAVDRVILRWEPMWQPNRKARQLHRFHVEHWQMGAEAWVARLLGWLRNRDDNGRALACGPVSLAAMDAMVMSPTLYPISADADLARDDGSSSSSSSKWALMIIIKVTLHDTCYVQYGFVRKRRPDADDAGEEDDDAWQVEGAQGFLEAEAPGAVDKDILDAEMRSARRAIVSWPRFGRKPETQSEQAALATLSWANNSETILGLLAAKPR